MLERLHERKELILGGSFAIIGIVLLLLAIPFVTNWSQILALSQSPGHPPTTCGTTANGAECLVQITWWAPPDPYPLIAAYGIAVPLVTALTVWILRAAKVQTLRYRRWSRAAVVLLLGSMGWVGGSIATGFALDWLSIPIETWYRTLFLVSVAVAPPIVLGVGTAYLGWGIRHRLSQRPRASAG